jgi:glucokinase
VRHAAALDVGGTKLAAGVVDADGAILARAVRPTPSTDDAEVLWAAVVDLLDEVRRGDEVVAGAGCGGPMAGPGVSPLHIPAWRDFPLRARLAEHLGVPAFVANDAHAIALAEGWRGAAAGARNFAGIVVSTGVGGGIVLDGDLLAGNAGHVGHVVVEPDGRPCRCGGRGCLEAHVSGTAVAEVTGRPAAEATSEAVAAAGARLGRAVASVANLLDLGLAVVGGSVALGWGGPFFAAAQEELDRRARLTFSRGARVVPAALGADAPLVGAAAIGWRGMPPHPA